MVALDERQHLEGRHRQGPRLDEARRHRRAQNFDAAMATPQIVDKRLVYMSRE